MKINNEQQMHKSPSAASENRENGKWQLFEEKIEKKVRKIRFFGLTDD